MKLNERKKKMPYFAINSESAFIYLFKLAKYKDFFLNDKMTTQI